MSDRHILPPYSLRMPAELRELLEEAAKEGKRSLNTEIVARLEKSFTSENAGFEISEIDAIRLQAVLTLAMLDGLDTSGMTSIQKMAAEALKPAAEDILQIWPVSKS